MIAPDALLLRPPEGTVLSQHEASRRCPAHYGKIPYVPVSQAILLRRVLLSTPLPKVLFWKMNHNRALLRISVLDEGGDRLAAISLSHCAAGPQSDTR